MFTSKKTMIWTISSFFIGTLLGSGAIWNWQELRLKEQRNELERRKEIVDLKNDISTVRLQMVNHVEKIREIGSAKAKETTLDKKSKLQNKRAYEYQRFFIMENKYKELEKKLAELESREPNYEETRWGLGPYPDPPTDANIWTQ